MFRNLSVLNLVFLSGCIFSWDPPPSSQSSHSNSDTTHSDYETDYDTDEIWIENVYLECEYDYYSDKTHWYVDVEIGSTYNYYLDEVEAGYHIDDEHDHAWRWLEFDGYDLWTDIFNTYLHPCDGFYDFYIEVEDIYGSFDAVIVAW
jgi:hypothetical protein|tara:strand:- start:1626 stop:2066 length:441 start_codon:yes stop_codon:yes gene_type:complete